MNCTFNVSPVARSGSLFYRRLSQCRSIEASSVREGALIAA